MKILNYGGYRLNWGKSSTKEFTFSSIYRLNSAYPRGSDGGECGFGSFGWSLGGNSVEANGENKLRYRLGNYDEKKTHRTHAYVMFVTKQPGLSSSIR